ncbi:Inner membrane protein YgaP [Phycisphaerales bacterium]|nr:Inner membrane protein YgaP [Phycisphaerales bacterium]
MSLATSMSAAARAAVPTVEPREARAWVEAGEAVVVDVREAEEHARERIGGCVLLPLSSFNPHELARFVGTRIVVHCRGGKRSAEACRLARAMERGVPDVYSLAGGIEAWKASGLGVEDGARAGSGVSVLRQLQGTMGGAVIAGCALAWLMDPVWLALPAVLGAGLLLAGVTGRCPLALVLEWMPWNRGRGQNGCGACGSESKPGVTT